MQREPVKLITKVIPCFKYYIYTNFSISEKYYRVKSAEVSLTKHPRHFSTMELSLNTFIYIYIVHGIYNIQYLLIGTNE